MSALSPSMAREYLALQNERKLEKALLRSSVLRNSAPRRSATLSAPRQPRLVRQQNTYVYVEFSDSEYEMDRDSSKIPDLNSKRVPKRSVDVQAYTANSSSSEEDMSDQNRKVGSQTNVVIPSLILVYQSRR